MRSIKFIEKRQAHSEVALWKLDDDIHTENGLIPSGTIGYLTQWPHYFWFCPIDHHKIPGASFFLPEHTHLPVTPISESDHQAITPEPEAIAINDRLCERCGRSCLKSGESWEELYSRTPWWDKPALIKSRTIKTIGKIRVQERWNRVPFTAYSVLGCGDRELTLCGDCLKKEKAAQKRRDAIALESERVGRQQLSLFEV